MRVTYLVGLGLVISACGRSSPQVAVEFSGPPGGGEPNLFATADGRVIMTWFEPHGSDAYMLKVAERADSKWGPAAVVARGRPFFVNWADFPSVIELQDGTWLVHWLEKVADDPYAYHVQLASSHDRGATWSEPVVPHDDRSATEHGFVSMVPWDSGAALIWLDGRAMVGAGSGHGGGESQGDMTLYATIVNARSEVSPNVLLDERTCECCTTSLVSTASGLLAAYRNRSPREIRDIAVVRFDGSRWSAPKVVWPDAWHFRACPVNGPQLAAVGDTVAVAWFTAANDSPRVYVAFSTDGASSFGEPVRVDDGLPRGRVDVVLDAAARTALVIWLEATNSGAEIRARGVARDGGVAASWSVGQTEDARASGFPRMARAGGEVLVAWTVPGTRGGIRVGVVNGDWNAF